MPTQIDAAVAVVHSEISRAVRRVENSNNVEIAIIADYYSAACARYKAHAAQGHLFDPQENTPKQGGLYD